MLAHRTLLIKRPLRTFTNEEREALVKVLTRADALGNLWARGFEVWPIGLDSRFADKFNYFKSELRLVNVKRWLARVHAIFNVGVRLDNERDMGQGVFIDLTRNALRLRWVIKRRAIVISLTESEAKYIRDRLSEGGKPKLARAWVDDEHLFIAITFERDAEQITPSNYRLVIDVNSWKNGIVYAIVKDSTRNLERLYNHVTKLERKYGALRRLGLHKTPYGRRLWREIKATKRRLYAYLRDYAQKAVSILVKQALNLRAKVIIDDIIEESRRELMEEKPLNGLAKVYMLYLRRFVKLLTNQLRWYGIPYEFKRLPSTTCPICGSELTQLPGRIMICSKCGFKADRDLVPILWAIKQP
ncbi:transposase, IS605 OrfB [Vulcanisaeta moutnovskia 768-28]|uniref:Transposase, IS605 OrfB n=1 Tax=Vulcanisaeta moutnovskia (strain 768-28) TaxID=985053 RepID=F0QYY0_VULM7|nr:zinc ribbon domain-containing protein [Vulcanisaeta moutnovskia]ADY00261.1 transposase, IS605 OrfB [Vulcanisaeta moutnovskia 768-28]